MKVEKYINRFGIAKCNGKILHAGEKIIKQKDGDFVDITPDEIHINPGDPIIILCKESTYPEVYIVITPGGMTWLHDIDFEYTDEVTSEV